MMKKALSYFSRNKCDCRFKIVVTGSCSVGKTCVVERFKSGYYSNHDSTIGVNFVVKTLLINDKNIKLHIWDTASQVSYAKIRQSYYVDAHAVMIIYDITNRSSFLNLTEWVEEMRGSAASAVPIFLIGNKRDCVKDREVTLAEALDFKEQVPGVMDILETSARDGTNIEEAFILLAKGLMENL